MTTDTTERGLERLVCTALTGSACDPGPAEAGAVHERPAAYGAGWICGAPEDYDREYCVDLVQLTAYLRHGLKHGPHHLDKEVAKACLEYPPGLIPPPSTASGRRTCRIRMPARRLHEPLGPRPRPRPPPIPVPARSRSSIAQSSIGGIHRRASGSHMPRAAETGISCRSPADGWAGG